MEVTLQELYFAYLYFQRIKTPSSELPRLLGSSPSSQTTFPSSLSSQHTERESKPSSIPSPTEQPLQSCISYPSPPSMPFHLNHADWLTLAQIPAQVVIVSGTTSPCAAGAMELSAVLPSEPMVLQVTSKSNEPVPS